MELKKGTELTLDYWQINKLQNSLKFDDKEKDELDKIFDQEMQKFKKGNSQK